MKSQEFRNLSDKELQNKLTSLKQELFNLRFSHATGSLTNPLAINTCKKDIAKVNTIIRERELGLSFAPKAEAKTASKAEKKASTTKKKTVKE